MGLGGKRLSYVYFFLFLLVIPSVGLSIKSIKCADTLAKFIQDEHALAAQAIRDAKKFADEYGLPVRVDMVGPPEFPKARMFVALDMEDPELLQAYMKVYQLTTGKGEIAGYLPLEMGLDRGDNAYITGVLRTDPNPETAIWRFGHRDVTWTDWKRQYYGQDPIFGFSHLIPLNEERLKNAKIFLEKPDLRGKCKAENCIAWLSTIELGTTAKRSTDEEREYLFNYLGMSRSSAHFEIGRRLMRGSNYNHAVVFVLVKGKEGLKAFKQLPKYLPADPKIPYGNFMKHDSPHLVGGQFNREAIEAVKIIPDGARVFFPIAAGASPEGFQYLVDRSKQVEQGFTIHVLVNGLSEGMIRDAVHSPHTKLDLQALFLGGNLREVNREGLVDVIPGNLADFPHWIKEGIENFQYDAIVVRVSEPDERGRYSLGPNYDHILSVIESLPNVKVIAEINPRIPRTRGNNFLKASQIHASFRSKTPLAGPPIVPLTEVEMRIGSNLAELVPSRAKLQLGIGNIFGGLPKALKEKGVTGVSIHTEMFGDPLMDLIKLGVAKKAVTGFAFGSDKMYKWLDGNQDVEFKPTEYVNDPGVIQEMRNFHAVVTSLQVNLYGETNATHGPDGRRVSSPGGQVEFMTAASRSDGGKAIVAIRSTAKNDTLSTIVLDLYPGPITTPHESVTHVVTEHGIAELRGRTTRERALALIQVAHPNFRKRLAADAVNRGLIEANDANAFN